MDTIIEVKGLKKYYKGFEAVKGLDLSVNKGEIFGFLGPNGAGKSTTINMLSTIVKPSEGHAQINGFDNVKEKNKVRASIGLIFQASTLDEKLTANENLKLHCKFYGVKKSLREERIQEVLEIVDLKENRYKIVETFSGGMKRRLEIARGLLNYPKVLFLDEPTVGLDPQTRAHLWEYILKLKEKAGITIFLTTHSMEEAEICDRVAIMNHGELIALDTPEQLKSKVGGDIIHVSTEDNQAAKSLIEERYGTEAAEDGEGISFRVENGSKLLVDFVKQFDIPIKSVNLRRPTLNDVFLQLAGREIGEDTGSDKDMNKKLARKGR
ncbi:ATP-binding cassette domain-containing protein [Halobacillus litoralis]|uniref:ABC transporter ATP-binding protein n=1 Tax=Halobacillus litoralis TaxID=45668 RepID=A0A410MA03_9BACI|nr:ATP-binding cassette domain-containing protein [Halobacillus litoralis]QAS51496.1 ABC transporter ATP-binding protein [Halobacillus litoralis]